MTVHDDNTTPQNDKTKSTSVMVDKNELVDLYFNECQAEKEITRLNNKVAQLEQHLFRFAQEKMQERAEKEELRKLVSHLVESGNIWHKAAWAMADHIVDSPTRIEYKAMPMPANTERRPS